MEDLTRRAFLRTAGLAAVGVFGASFALAQQTDKEKDEGEGKKEEDPSVDDLFGETSPDEETRACPQCGALMYKDGNTWTCETCGYSYVE